MDIKPVESNQTIVKEIDIQKYLLIGVSVLALILLLSLSYIIMSLTNSKIYPDIKIMGVNVTNLTKEEALEKISKHYENARNESIDIKVDGKSQIIKFDELNIAYDVNSAVGTAYKLGREGNLFKRIFQIISLDIKGKNLEIATKYDLQKLNSLVDKIEKDIASNIKEHQYEIKGNNLIFIYGHGGMGVDRKKLISSIEQKIREGKGDELEFAVENVNPTDFDVTSISSEPKDATFIVEKNSTLKYINEQPGVILDREMFKKLYDKNLPSKSSFTIPVEIVMPKVTVESLKKSVFSDTLASFETYYGTSPANRKVNVQLAASKISDYILGPGDEFSYNKVVGPRTVEKGFKMAHVYSNGKIIDDIGGGICQVSTTLYNAVIRADLEITERQNHMFTVSYVPAGMDATVNYGTIDFRFKNNTGYPVKLVNNTTPNNVKFTILGTNENPQKTVDFRRDVLKTIPYSTNEILDSNLQSGKVVIEQKGSNGYVVNVYKIIKENNAVIKEEFFNKSSYRPLNTTLRKGTKFVPKTDNPVIENVIPKDIQQQSDHIIDENPNYNDQYEIEGQTVPVINEDEQVPILQ